MSMTGQDGAELPQSEEANALASLERERDELLARYQRTLADFQNYQRRSLQNEREARTAGLLSSVQGFIPVLEHLDMALAQSTGEASASQVIEGVRAIRDEMVKALRVQGIEPIEPSPNDPFVPGRHEAIAQQSGDGVEPGRIVSTMQVGYAMGERLIRPARVVVAPME